MGRKSTVSVARKATLRARPRLFGQFRTGFSAKFVCSILHRTGLLSAQNPFQILSHGGPQHNMCGCRKTCGSLYKASPDTRCSRMQLTAI
jgi:hypothetical protein